MNHDDFDRGFDGFDDEPNLPAPKLKKPKLARSVKERDLNLSRVEAQYPDVAAWWKNSTFEFALSLKSAARDWGALTDGQLTAARKCIAKFAAAKEAAARRAAEAPALECSDLAAAFARGVGVLRVAFDGRTFKISEAKTSWNKGFVFVNREELYLGKIDLNDGKFLAARDCPDEDVEALAAAIGDLEGCAVAYGRLTNRCSCCGRELNNPESVRLGIGPICRGKFFG